MVFKRLSAMFFFPSIDSEAIRVVRDVSEVFDHIFSNALSRLEAFGAAS